MINLVLAIFLVIVGLFIILFLIKQLTGWKFCVICLSVSLTWLGLLTAYWLDQFVHPELIAVLLGQSVIGVYYLAEKRLPESWQIWRLPFLLSLTLGAYALLGLITAWSGLLVLLLVLWLITTGLYIYRHHGRFSQLFERLIACCRDW